jgi:hypothetical protein
MTLIYEWVTDDAGLDALRVPWAPLVVEDAPGSPFRTWEWQATWWRTLGRRRGRELRILVTRDGHGAVRAILPMYLERGSVAGIVPRRRASPSPSAHRPSRRTCRRPSRRSRSTRRSSRRRCSATSGT